MCIRDSLGLEELPDVDLTSVKGGFGLDQGVDRLTHRDLQARRALIQQRMRGTEEAGR